MPQLLLLVLFLLIFAGIVYLIYQVWLWTTTVVSPFLVQWWWFALLAAMLLGSLQARTLMRKAAFAGFAGNRPVLPPDFDQLLPAEQETLKELLRERSKLKKLLDEADQQVIALSETVRITKSGKADQRSQAGRDYELYGEAKEVLQKSIMEIDQQCDELRGKPARRLAEWRSQWSTYGAIQGLRSGAVAGGILGLAVYAYLLWWRGQTLLWPVIGSAVSFAVMLGVFATYKSAQFEDLADSAIAQAEQDRAARNARPVFGEVERITPRLEA